MLPHVTSGDTWWFTLNAISSTTNPTPTSHVLIPLHNSFNPKHSVNREPIGSFYRSACNRLMATPRLVTYQCPISKSLLSATTSNLHFDVRSWSFSDRLQPATVICMLDLGAYPIGCNQPPSPLMASTRSSPNWLTSNHRL